MTQMAINERPSSRAAHGHIHRLAFVCAFPFVEDISFEIRLQGCVILHVVRHYRLYKVPVRDVVVLKSGGCRKLTRRRNTSVPAYEL